MDAKTNVTNGIEIRCEKCNELLLTINDAQKLDGTFACKCGECGIVKFISPA